MNQRNTLLCAAALSCLAVIIGAFGAHGFKAMLSANGRSETYELAVRYQFYHALAMLAVGTVMNQFPSRFLRYASSFFFLGIFFFSGSLYALCFTEIGVLGAITPIGGILFILGWAFLFMAVYKK